MGAGNGLFSSALSDLLLSGSKIYTVDKDEKVLNISSSNPAIEIIPIQADFEKIPEFPIFDGILMANALHYVKAPIPFLQNLLQNLKPNGDFVLIEYDTEKGNPWVPFPVSFQKWERISTKVGLSVPRIFNERISRYGQGTMYAAINFLKD